MYRSICLIFVYLPSLCLICALDDDCSKPLYTEWCRGKRTPICNNNDMEPSFVLQTRLLILQYSKQFTRNKLCNRINSDSISLDFDINLAKIANHMLTNNIWSNRSDMCFTIPSHPSVRIVQYPYHSTTNYSEALASQMNIRAFGCAKTNTDLLCIFSDSDPFGKFQQFVVNNGRYCGESYKELHSDICYLHDTTVITIQNHLSKMYDIRWDAELEYLAQGGIATDSTDICYTKDRRRIKLSSINYFVDGINNFDVTNIVQSMIESGEFQVLNDSQKYIIGCTFYDLKINSLRVLCLFDTIKNDRDLLSLTAWNDHFKSMAHHNTYVVYSLVVLIYTNIVIILLCTKIVFKFRTPWPNENYDLQPIYSLAS